MFRKTAMILMVLGLSGCISQSQIQSKYVKTQNACREESSRIAGATNDQTALGQAFSECMNKAGWHVASPKTGVATNNPPSGSPSTNPSAASAVAANPPPQTGAQAAAANPPSGAPSVKPSAAAASVPAPAPVAEPTATYQPARPVTNDSPAYGAGAGRNF